MKLKKTHATEDADSAVNSIVIATALNSLFLALLIFGLYTCATTALALSFGGASHGEAALGDLFVNHLILLESLCAFPAILVCGILGALAFRSGGRSLLFCWLYRASFAFLLVSFIIGWAHFIYAGKFPGWDTYGFYARSPFHLIEHAFVFSPIGLLLLVALCGGLVVLMPVSCHFFLSQLSLRVKLFASLIAVFGIGVGYLLYSPGGVLGIKGSEMGRLRLSSSDYKVRTSTVEDFLESYLLDKCGPATSLLLPYFREVRSFQSDPEAFELEWSERLSVEAYAKSVQSLSAGKVFPNVILVLVESLRHDVLFSEAHAEATMPFLESLASEGAIFRNHYSSSSHSSYADISAISGIYPLWGNRIHIYSKAEPEYARPRIYDLQVALGGRAAIFSSQNENWGGMLDYLQSDALDVIYHAGALSYGEEALGRMLSLNGGKGFDRDTIEAALAWMDSGNTPFFTYLNLQGSHYPYYFPDSEKRPFGGEFDSSELNFLNLPQAVIPAVRARYRDSLYFVDQQIGYLVAELKRTGRWEDTLLIVSGDTGQAFGEHGFTGHARDLFDEVVRTPLILAGGAFKQPGIYEMLSHHVDIAPTILGLLDLPSFEGFQGVDLFGQSERTWAPLVCQSPALKQVAIVASGWKMMFDWNTGNIRLYNLNEDPGENQPMEVMPGACSEQLKAMLETWVFHQMNYYNSKELSEKYFAPGFSNPIPCR